jgi:hypothetical protein
VLKEKDFFAQPCQVFRKALLFVIFASRLKRLSNAQICSVFISIWAFCFVCPGKTIESGRCHLVHGVQDQTVVMQQSMKFLHECVKQGKQVDFFVYPTHPHNVRGKERIHLMEKVSNYFFDNL